MMLCLTDQISKGLGASLPLSHGVFYINSTGATLIESTVKIHATTERCCGSSTLPNIIKGVYKRSMNEENHKDSFMNSIKTNNASKLTTICLFCLKEEQLCWVSSLNRISSCMLTHRETRPTDIHTFAPLILNAQTYSNTGYSK